MTRPSTGSGRTAFVLLAALLLTGKAVAAEKEVRVGLALSGGGARGLAHIGVLKALKEKGVPVHAVAGTSMGSIVGGLFAAGHSPQDLEDLLLVVPWQRLLQGQTDREFVPVSQKGSRQTYTLEFVVRRLALVPPVSLRTTQPIMEAFSGWTLSASNRADFDFRRLPVPFTAVAADFLTGVEVRLTEGALADAMLASMSLPGIYPPVRRDGRLLVDGGLVKNIPVDVVRDMGADVVIAVDAGGSPVKWEEELKGLPNVLSQSIQIMTAEADRRQLALADFVVEPDMAGRALMDFSAPEAMVRRGEEAVRNDWPRLKALLEAQGVKLGPAAARSGADDVPAEVRALKVEGGRRPGLHNALRARLTGKRLAAAAAAKEAERFYLEAGYPLAQAAVRAWDPSSGALALAVDEGTLSDVTVSGARRTRDFVLKREFKTRPGDVFYMPRVREDVARLSGTGLFRTVSFRLEPSTGPVPSGKQGPGPAARALRYEVVEAERTWLRLGQYYDSAAASRFQAVTELSRVNVLGVGAVASLEGRFGDVEHFGGRLYVPRLFDSFLFLTLRGRLHREEFFAHVFDNEGSSRTTRYREKRQGGAALIGFESSFGQLSAGYRRERLRVTELEDAFLMADLTAKDIPLSTRTLTVTSILLESTYDSLDRFPFPTRGGKRRVVIELADPDLGGDVRFAKFNYDFEVFWTWRARHTVHGGMNMAVAGGAVPLPDLQRGGGMGSVMGYLSHELFNRNLIIGHLNYRMRLDALHPRWDRTYAHLFLDFGNSLFFREDRDIFPEKARIGGGGAGFSFETPLGPLTLAWGVNDEDQKRGYFTWGIPLR